MSLLCSRGIAPRSLNSPATSTGDDRRPVATPTDPIPQNRFKQVTLCDVLVSIATPPILLAVIGGQLGARSITAIGQLSEDILRGDRLPVLHFPKTPPES